MITCQMEVMIQETEKIQGRFRHLFGLIGNTEKVALSSLTQKRPQQGLVISCN